MAELQAQLDDSRTQLAVAEVTFENQLDVERRKHAEEIASIQHLEKGGCREPSRGLGTMVSAGIRGPALECSLSSYPVSFSWRLLCTAKVEAEVCFGRKITLAVDAP